MTFAANFTTTEFARTLHEGDGDGTEEGYSEDGYDLDLDTVRTIAHNLDLGFDGRQLALTPGNEKADNDLRAAWAFRALDAYVRRVSPDGDSFDGMLSDLFTDLMHLCCAVGVDAEQVVEKSTRRYTEEVHGEA